MFIFVYFANGGFHVEKSWKMNEQFSSHIWNIELNINNKHSRAAIISVKEV